MKTQRCTKCRKNDAAIHFTPVVDGKLQKTVHLCKDCAPPRTRSHTLDPKAITVKGKRCDFCGRRARFHFGGFGRVSGEAHFICTECATEFRDILLDLANAEKVQLFKLEQIEGTVTCISGCVPQVQAYRKAIEILKERRAVAAKKRSWLRKILRA